MTAYRDRHLAGTYQDKTKPHIVGEKGRELFVPKKRGKIVPKTKSK